MWHVELRIHICYSLWLLMSLKQLFLLCLYAVAVLESSVESTNNRDIFIHFSFHLDDVSLLLLPFLLCLFLQFKKKKNFSTLLCIDVKELKRSQFTCSYPLVHSSLLHQSRVSQCDQSPFSSLFQSSELSAACQRSLRFVYPSKFWKQFINQLGDVTGCANCGLLFPVWFTFFFPTEEAPFSTLLWKHCGVCGWKG